MFLWKKMQTDKQHVFTTESKRKKQMLDKKRAQMQVEAQRSKKSMELEEDRGFTRKISKPLSSSGLKRDEDDPVVYCKIMVRPFSL
jgi:hypothetical protein